MSFRRQVKFRRPARVKRSIGSHRRETGIMVLAILGLGLLLFWAFGKINEDINAGIQRELNGEEYGER